MEFFRRILVQIKSQLGGLTVAGKLNLVLLAAFVVICSWLVVRWSAEQTMVPLLNQSFSEVELQQIVQKLDSWQEEYAIKGDRIIVPQSRQKTLLAKLAYAEVLPQDTSTGWSSLLEDSDIWTPDSVRENKKKIILQKMLALSIAEWPGLAKAEVFINEGSQRRLNNITPAASASVTIQMQDGKTATRKLASAIASLVSGSVNRLKRENVKVIADGSLITVKPEGEGFSSDYLEQKRQWEELLRKKILNALPVKNALVVVDVILQNTKKQVRKTEVAPDGEGSLIATIEQTSMSEESDSSEPGQEPGIMANVTTDEPAAAGTKQSQTAEDSTKRSQVVAGSTETFEETGIGGIMKEDLTATVSIPLAYFEGIAKRQAGQDAEPTAEMINTITDKELTKLRLAVRGAIGLTAENYGDQVVVDTYWAGGIAADKAAMPGQSDIGQSAGALSNITGRYGKQIAISSLALISLVMVLMMVRKASTPVEINDKNAQMMMGKRPIDALSPDELDMADGEMSGGVLSGIELDESAVRSQQVLQQIKDMVNESPEVAAKLVGNWIKET